MLARQARGLYLLRCSRIQGWIRPKKCVGCPESIVPQKDCWGLSSSCSSAGVDISTHVTPIRNKQLIKKKNRWMKLIYGEVDPSLPVFPLGKDYCKYCYTDWQEGWVSLKDQNCYCGLWCFSACLAQLAVSQSAVSGCRRTSSSTPKATEAFTSWWVHLPGDLSIKKNNRSPAVSG